MFYNRSTLYIVTKFLSAQSTETQLKLIPFGILSDDRFIMLPFTDAPPTTIEAAGICIFTAVGLWFVSYVALTQLLAMGIITCMYLLEMTYKFRTTTYLELWCGHIRSISYCDMCLAADLKQQSPYREKSSCSCKTIDKHDLLGLSIARIFWFHFLMLGFGS